MMTGMSRYFCHDHPDVRPLRILKIDNKGRHNRRVKYGIVT